MTDFGPCAAWPVIWPCDVLSVSPYVTGVAVDVATDILWSLSGMQFGTCQVTLRPCRRDCYNAPWPPDVLWWPGAVGAWSLLAGGLAWIDATCGTCANTCSCNALSEVQLPAPVTTIDVVKVDGAVLVTGAYRLDNNRLLVRLDGQMWPRCNDLMKADTQVGTWSVTATYGQPIPQLASLAAGELACELVRAINGEDCRLPTKVQSLARQGVTIQFPSILESFKDGRLGLYVCDLFITTVNPKGLARRARTYSVDRPTHRRVGT